MRTHSEGMHHDSAHCIIALLSLLFLKANHGKTILSNAHTVLQLSCTSLDSYSEWCYRTENLRLPLFSTQLLANESMLTLHS